MLFDRVDSDFLEGVLISGVSEPLDGQNKESEW